MSLLATSGFIDWNQLGPFTALLFHELHYGALAFMVVAYAIKVRQLLNLPATTEGTPPRGDHAKAIGYAYLTLAMPWELESQRQDWSSYVEFVCLHLSIAFNLGMALTLPIAHEALRRPSVIIALHWILLTGAAIGILRLANRLTQRALRAISSPDDYLCLVLLV